MGVSNAFFGTKLVIDGEYPQFSDYKSKEDLLTEIYIFDLSNTLSSIV